MWGISCRCFISLALISSNEHFPSYPQCVYLFPKSCSFSDTLRELARTQFPLLCFCDWRDLSFKWVWWDLGIFHFFFLMKKEDSLLLPLVSLKSLPSARRFMRPQSPRNNMRKSWSEGCSRSPKHAVQRSSGLGKCGCVEWISWGVCALLRRTHWTNGWPWTAEQGRGFLLMTMWSLLSTADSSNMSKLPGDDVCNAVLGKNSAKCVH